MRCVNALGRASSISTAQRLTQRLSVNALSWAYLISTMDFDVDQWRIYSACQCPQSGLYHFYADFGTVKTSYDLCQCPKSGSFHFYGTPPKTPIESAFPAPFLGGICQNILTIRIFRLKNGMFTNCSYFVHLYTTIFPSKKQDLIFHT